MSITLPQIFELEYCCTCGVAFAIPKDLQEKLKETHRGFYCPNGHSQSYSGPSQAERQAASLKRELEQEQHRHLLTANALDATKRAERKLLKRIEGGVCPCCNRTFQDLQRHMKTKHQDEIQKRLEATQTKLLTQ